MTPAKQLPRNICLFFGYKWRHVIYGRLRTDCREEITAKYSQTSDTILQWVSHIFLSQFWPLLTWNDHVKEIGYLPRSDCPEVFAYSLVINDVIYDARNMVQYGTICWETISRKKTKKVTQKCSVQSNLCIGATLGTGKKWSLVRGGRYSGKGAKTRIDTDVKRANWQREWKKTN